jgi:signal transduction histidine kinase
VDESFEPVSLADVITDVVRERTIDERYRMCARVQTDGTISGDASLLHSLVWNLVDNALKFSAKGPVTLELRERDDRVELVVIDAGPGIPKSLRQRVFAPFFRARADASSGHGIGLALVLHIARAHGARVELADVSAGTEVRVEFPRWTATRPKASCMPVVAHTSSTV